MTFLFDSRTPDHDGVVWDAGDLFSANVLLARHHYLGPARSADLVVIGALDGVLVAAQVWHLPTSKALPCDGSWLELSRWCLTPDAGSNAGSRQHKASVRLLRELRPKVTTLVSYSDPSVGHTGALYRACNWSWAPTWQRLRPPPSAGGSWDGITQQSVKDRWVFCLRRDDRRTQSLAVNDAGALKFWQRTSPAVERKWAAASLSPDLRKDLP